MMLDTYSCYDSVRYSGALPAVARTKGAREAASALSSSIRGPDHGRCFRTQRCSMDLDLVQEFFGARGGSALLFLS